MTSNPVTSPSADPWAGDQIELAPLGGFRTVPSGSASHAARAFTIDADGQTLALKTPRARIDLKASK